MNDRMTRGHLFLASLLFLFLSSPGYPSSFHLEKIACKIDRFTPIVKKAWYGNTASVKRLLDEGADIDDSSSGCTPLMAAARQGHADTVNLLVSEGAEVNYINRRSYTALILAAKHGHSSIVTTLLEHGAATGIKDYDTAHTALTYAEEGGYQEIVRLIRRASAPARPTPLMFAAQEGDLQEVKALLKSGVDVNVMLGVRSCNHTFFSLQGRRWVLPSGTPLLLKASDLPAPGNSTPKPFVFARSHGGAYTGPTYARGSYRERAIPSMVG